MTAHAELDHLVVAAATLEQGVAWCERTLGITPGPGGRHDFMGTHNRLLSITAPGFPRAYFEIIAVDPQAAAPGRRRWFDLDDPALQAAVAREPQLVHWVARTPDVRAAVSAWAALGLDRGPVLDAQRALPGGGVLRWKITVRDDGQRLWDGALPTLIEWGDIHPADAMPDSGVRLASATWRGADEAALHQARQAIGLAQLAVQSDPTTLAVLEVELETPRGRVRLRTG